MSDAPSILIVDDHQDIRDPLSTYLARLDFDVEAVADGKAMRQRLQERKFSLIILDIMLPGEKGFSLCRYVSEQIGTPVILLTAVSEPADRIAGLEIGADDYVIKPFDPRELVARIRSVLRRTERRSEVIANTHLMPAPTSEIYRFSGWTLNVTSQELRHPDGKEVELSTAEFRVFKALLENANRVLSREHLLDLTQKHDELPFDRSIDTQISRLRKKIEADPRNPRLIKTIYGYGYMFTGAVTTEKS